MTEDDRQYEEIAQGLQAQREYEAYLNREYDRWLEDQYFETMELEEYENYRAID